ncbi:lipopolysaccharide biosynthesis protein [Frigoribacterium sp. 9N]|uniref:lipopolysaccharide biosynthesis protein n=1 Tax=Frigoribacterium sp. 9N TaxID=2653144 RepID=UPI0012F20DB8|nr:lipopolysaccharide biosynthesis protein [Frigoribacterium sp. 9N]VXC20850.1 conserved membrane hypothetical protein [Frigoribacterium sp. 9N]
MGEPLTTPAGSSALASSAVLSTAGIVVQGVSRLAYTVVLGRVFGTEALGHASALLSLSIFAALLWPTAAGTAASRFFAVASHEKVGTRPLARLLDRSMAVSTAALALAAVPTALVLGNGIGVALSAAWLVAGYGVYAYTRGVQLGRHRAARVALWDGLTATLSLGLVAVVAVVGDPAWALVPLSVAYTVFAVVNWPRSRSGQPLTGDVDGVLSFAAWNVLAGLTTNGLLQLAMLSAQYFGPGAQAGVYAAAFTLATPASMLGQAISQIVIPAFAHRSDGASFRNRRTAGLVIGLAGVMALGFGAVAALAPIYLPLFYPAVGVEAVPLLQFLMLGVFVFTIALVPAALLLAAGRSRQVALASISGFVGGLAVIVVSGPSLGVQAGSLGFLVGSSVNLVAMVVLNLRVPGRGRGGPVVESAPTTPGHAIDPVNDE